VKPLTVALLVALLLTAACARRERPTPTPGPTPTEIIYPPTWTPEPTIGPTPAPPTRTPNPATALVLKAIKNTDGLRVYSAEQTITVNSPNTTFFGEPAGKPFTFIHVQGSVHDTNSKWTMNGALIRILTGDPSRSLQIIQVGEKYYIQGPLPLLGATQRQWYYTDSTTSSDLFNSTDTNNRLNLLSSLKAAPPSFAETTKENLDQRTCTHYHSAGKEAGDFLYTIEAERALSNGTLTYPIDSQTAQLDTWVCDDGYIHRLDIHFTIRCGCPTNNSAQIGLTVHLWDMNIIIPVTAPTNALPLNRRFTYPTPLPINPIQTSTN